ncbi:ribonuclease H (plasmid) [Jeotgalibacillus malaysiensis]|uniref:ribonuclease H n=1 Tax=Jeotgalibacillus malaysiensis TaxID=1508404 RepID=A0A0B5AX35_9BACL|nr:ribonuclease H family protein [Jeotgalibacillus malaysiensis]AJD93133.1 ribonuclease H [Jeotgalibacillus malaysiensis]
MAKSKAKFYAVLAGHKPGIYLTWAECQEQTKGFKGAKYKSFPTREEANLFMKGEVVVTSAEKKKEDYIVAAKEAERYAIEVSKEAGTVAIYTDGSRKQKPESEDFVFGCGVAIIDGGDIQHSFGKASDYKPYAVYENVAGELLGAGEAFRYLQNNRPDVKKVVFFYDYQGIGHWAQHTWKAKNDMTQRYVAFMDTFRQETGVEIDFRHVKGHVGNKFNEHVDEIAGRVIDEFIAKLQKGA